MTDQPTKAQPTTSLDQRFSDPEAGPTPGTTRSTASAPRRSTGSRPFAPMAAHTPPR